MLNAREKKSLQEMQLSYAKKFRIYQNDRIKLIEVNAKSLSAETYVLAKEKIDCAGVLWIPQIIKRVIALSTTHIPPLVDLKLESKLVGFGSPRLIYAPELQNNIRMNAIKDVGHPVNPEIVLTLKPDLVVSHTVGGADLEGINKLKVLGIKIVLNLDYEEDHPLARAEWIKFMAAFFDKGLEAEEIFKEIAQTYLYWTAKSKIGPRPKVLVGMSNGGIWQAAGGDSDLAKIISDAGGDYIWKDKTIRNSLSISWEEAFSKARQTDIWLPQNTWNDLDAVYDHDRRYAFLAPVKNQKIFNFNRRTNQYGGLDYWERGVMRPDLLIQDLVGIFYPGLVSKRTSLWYQKLAWKKSKKEK